MKKMIGSFVSIVVLPCLIAPSALAATKHVTKITINCPDISNKTKDKLVNYGTYISGFGTERVNSDSATHPLFQTPINLGSIPLDLTAAGYDGTHVSYEPTTGVITCFFESNLGHPPFSVDSRLLNARYGITVGSGDEEIKIKVPVGSP